MTYLPVIFALCRQFQTCLSTILVYVLLTCWLEYIVSVLSRLVQAFSLYCDYMMESSKETNFI